MYPYGKNRLDNHIRIASSYPNVEDIEKAISEILENPKILEDYAIKAKDVIIKNHDKNTNLTMVQNDFKEVLNKK